MSSNLGLAFSEFNLRMGKPSVHKIYEFGGFRLDADHLMLSRDGTELPLAPKAVETLLALIEHRGNIINKAELLEAVWPDTAVEESNLFLYLSVLRKTLGSQEDGKPWIETLRRRGYRFCGQVRVIDGAGENHYARIVDIPSAPDINVETQSGRFYVLKDWELNKTQSASAPGSARVALKPVEDRDESPSGIYPSSDDPDKDQKRAYLNESGKSPSRKPLLTIGTGAVVILLTVGIIHKFQSAPDNVRPIRSVAVLPFKPIGEDDRDAKFETGVTHELIMKLAGAEGLEVKPFSAVRRFAASQEDPVVIGHELGVDAVLDGSVQISDGRVRVAVKLISVLDSKQIWAETIDEERTHVFDVKEAISERVARALKVKLGENALRRYTENKEAYNLYIEGRSHLFNLDPAEVKLGIEKMEQAVAIDANYALAYTGIARGYLSFVLSAEVRPGDMGARSFAAAEKAVKLDPQLAEAHSILGSAYFWFKHDWAAAERSFRKALELDPGSATAHQSYASLLGNLGKIRESLAEAEKARNIDQYSAYSTSGYGTILIHAGMPEEALTKFSEASRLSPKLWLPHSKAALALIDLHRFDHAVATARKAFELNPAQTNSISYEIYALARLGRHDEAKAILDGLLKRSAEGYVPQYHIAVAYMGFGDRTNALNWLEKGFEEKDPRMVFLRSERFWDDLRSEPRFIDLMMKLNF